MPPKKGSDQPVVIKKYANRRLYDTGRSSYVTLDDLAQMIKDGYEFNVYDAKTGDDLTRQVLTQIIVEQEAKGAGNLLPINFLRQLIGFYGDNMSPMVPNYLEQAFNLFTQQQDQFREQIKKTITPVAGNAMPQNGQFPPMFGMQNLEELSKQNMAMFEQAMKAFGQFQQTMQAGKNPFDVTKK
jgi:polyhydroxyalkanoate synthesis repressor PhaR